MASRRTTYEIAALLFVTIILIVLLVLVGITFDKVNNQKTVTEEPRSPPTFTVPSLPSRSTAPTEPPPTTRAPPDVPYKGKLGTKQRWDDNLDDPNSPDYLTNVTKYEKLITDSLSKDYRGASVEVTGFSKSPGSTALRHRKQSTADDDVKVSFDAHIPADDGHLKPDDVEKTINDNIQCNCTVTDLGFVTKPTRPTRPTTTRGEETSERPPIRPDVIAAEYLKRNMDERYHPCEDFYKFACGKFTRSFPPPRGVTGYGTFDLVQDRIIDKIDVALRRINVTDPTIQPWQEKVKRFYDSCGTLIQKGMEYNKRLLEIIDDFGGWPIIMEPGKWDNKSLNLATTLAKLTTNYSVQTLVTAAVDLNWDDPKSYMLQIDQATLALGNPAYYDHVRFEDDRRDYVELIKQTAAVLRYDQDMPQNDEEVSRMAQDILDFERLISKYVKTDDQRKSYAEMYHPQNTKTVQSNYNFMNWDVYFDTLLPDCVKPYKALSNIVEPGYMLKLTDIVQKVRPETLQNYLVWRLVYSLNMFFDDRLGDLVESFRARSKHIGVGAREKINLRSRGDCTTMVINNLAFAASNLLIIDELDDDEKNNIEVLNMTAHLKEAFKGQLDTLFWMDDDSREIAKQKLDDYVENAGFPKLLLNKDEMNDYFHDFFVRRDDEFFDNYIELMTFHELTQFRVLCSTPTRKMWVLPPAIVNAWYIPDFNSITFPAGILRPPFFRHDFPRAVNYGALGTVIGHEMTHGFDDQGVQFNGTGYLETWMSRRSRAGFHKMIDCVIRQYDRTCYSQVDMCIDGDQTQGENTADNGGIREAYDAYQMWVKEYGPEERLPGLENYTMDQIFFLSFANVWCGDYETKDYLEQQIVTNVHSPPPTRVLNTLKNFPDFGRTFQCEAGQKYYPFRSEACNVWYSPPVSDNPVYNISAEYMLANMNHTVDPCDNFFEYACGRFVEHHDISTNMSTLLAIGILQNEIYTEIIDKFDKLPSNATQSLKDAKTYYDICKSSNDNETVNNTEILKVINQLGGWPAIKPATAIPQSNADVKTNVSKLVGSLASMFGVQTFLVASTVVDPGNTDRHVLAIDQSSLALGAVEYYTEEKLKDVLDTYQNFMVDVIIALANSTGVKINYQDAYFSASAIVNFEIKLAQGLYPDRKRRNFTDLYNAYNITELKKTFMEVDWDSYFTSLFYFSPDLKNFFQQGDTTVVISEPHFIHDLGVFLMREYDTDQTILQNYLVWRFIYARSNFLHGDVSQHYTALKKMINGARALPPGRLDCVDQLTNMLGYTTGRLFVEDWDKRAGWREDVSEMIHNITTVFDETIPRLDWMDRRSQEGARTKINMLAENPAFPDWILNDTLLNDYYKDYKINPASDYFDVFNQLNQFAMAKAFEAILQRVDRKDFQMSPATVNAWYNPTLNSLTVPAGFLNPPFYHPELPAGLKYGYVGVVMGHELTHAFDDSGIQFDGEGFLDLWMTKYSRDSYDKHVKDCVINQYSHYCHFDGEFCNDGVRTQGENIADNGGIRQAFKAYRNQLREKIRREGYGEELLPGMEWFNEDQLFFIGFANLWCGFYSDKYVVNELLTDPHSPGMDRVKGSVSNFEEFDKAFHCDIGQPMNPAEKCYVWTDPTETTDGYNKAAKMLLESLDPTAEPCDDFFQYACGGWIDRHPIPKHASTISTNSLSEDAVLLATSYGIDNVSPEEKSTALQKTKKMFDFCKKDLNDSDSTSLLSFQKDINEGLGGWPIITSFWQPSKDNINLDQAFYVAGKLGAIGLQTIFNAYPQPNFAPDVGEPKHYALFIDQAQLLLNNRDIYLNKSFEDIMDAYRDVLTLTAMELARANCSRDKRDSNCVARVPIESIRADVEDIIDFEKALARISLPVALQQNYTAMYHPYTYTELKREYGNINWDAYFKALLPESEDILEMLTSDQIDIVVSERSYLDGLNKTLPYFSLRTIQNYLVWRYTINSASLLGSGMKAALLRLKQKTEFVEDLRDDVSICTQDTINLLPYASGRLYVEEAFGDERKRHETHRMAAELVDEIVEQFHQRLMHLPWLDKLSRNASEDKIHDLIHNIAYPDWIFNDTVLDGVYDSLKVDVSADYYTTKRDVSLWFYQARFHALDPKVPVDRYNFQMSPAIQNAWYQPWLNSLTIPAGEIQTPFYDNDFPSAVNFGGLGAVAGHELTHGFDDDGVQFGPKGGLVTGTWMSQESRDYFHQNISECVIDQYDHYCYPDLPSGKMCINGKATQGENIADIGGTKTAFNAYKEWVRRHGYEALLPGLESFTMDQIFFLEFAQSWCGAIKPEALEKQLLLDVHSPYRNRVIGTLSDMKEFADAFRCKPGDRMVPKDRCDVW